MISEEKKILFTILETQNIIIQQLNGIVDLLSNEFDISIENGILEVGEDK